MQASRAVLITGCSSGIGAAAAAHLADRGWTVYASARQLEAIQPLAAKGCRLLQLDVTDEGSRRRAVAEVEAAEGAVGVLVNNAGYSQSGALEEVELEDARRQFETNVFGLLRMTQLCLPGMRRQGWGKVVNVSSMGGRFTFPGGGLYHATKHAVEALSDSLRFEVRRLGVDVVLIEPGLVRTRFGETAAGSIGGRQTPYSDFNRSVRNQTLAAYEGGAMSRFAVGPERVARVIEKAISSRRPRARYRVTLGARAVIVARRLLPTGPGTR